MGLSAAAAPGRPAYNQDIAPLLWARCASCHRPGQSAPFALLTYAEAKKHAPEISEAVRRRLMPPWPPAAGCASFTGSRALKDEEITLLNRWVETGMEEGSAAGPPPEPHWKDGWQLGTPDLVITLPRPYRLEADGPDLYRNFILPAAVASSRYVHALEFQPGNPACVHHAFIKLARTPAARRLDGREEQPGFGGLMLPEGVEMPEGHFLTWQPGKQASAEDPRLAWKLNPGDDLVLQLHLRRTGKPELVQPSVAFYFTDRAPSLAAFKFALSTFLIDLPAGAPDTVVRDSWELPAGLRLLRVLPHAHYLGRDLQGYATLPDGSRVCLIHIPDWDFNWQGDYEYSQPVDLPRGSVVSMEYHYDNSTNNLRNPSHPPRRVRYGPGSADEMAELWFQALPLEEGSLPVLKKAYNQKVAKISAEYARRRLEDDPADHRARLEWATILLGEGKRTEARENLERVVAAEPQNANAHYLLGVLARLEQRLPDARRELEAAIAAGPGDHKFHGNLGLVLAGLGELDGAEKHLEEALRLDPGDTLAKSALDELRQARLRRK